jgi:hypothetical protein
MTLKFCLPHDWLRKKERKKKCRHTVRDGRRRKERERKR